MTISDLNASRLEAIDRAEAAGRQLAAALGDARAAHVKMRQACMDAGRPLSGMLSDEAFERRLADRLIALLRGESPGRVSFGSIPLPHSSDNAWTGGWSEAERSATAKSNL